MDKGLKEEKLTFIQLSEDSCSAKITNGSQITSYLDCSQVVKPPTKDWWCGNMSPGEASHMPLGWWLMNKE